VCWIWRGWGKRLLKTRFPHTRRVLAVGSSLPRADPVGPAAQYVLGVVVTDRTAHRDPWPLRCGEVACTASTARTGSRRNALESLVFARRWGARCCSSSSRRGDGRRRGFRLRTPRRHAQGAGDLDHNLGCAPARPWTMWASLRSDERLKRAQEGRRADADRSKRDYGVTASTAICRARNIG